jgi:hypothetical protein
MRKLLIAALAGLAACAAPGRPVDRLVAEAASAPNSLDRVHRLRDLEFYFRCRAAAAGEPSACDALGAVKDPSAPVGTLAERCRLNFLMLAFERDVMARGASAAGSCAAYLARQQDVKDVPKACEVFTGDTTDVEASCKKLAPSVAPKKEWDCANYMRMLHGVPRCGGVPEDGDEAVCDDLAALYAGLHGGGPAACGDLPLCRALMGGGTAACDGLAAKLEKR